MSPRFQPFQFDKALDSSTPDIPPNVLSMLYGEYKVGRGFQIIKPRVTEKKKCVPEWAKNKDGSRNNEAVQKILLTAFPRLHISKPHRVKAGRWAQIIELLYWNELSETEVAEAMDETVYAIRSAVRSMNRRAHGKRTDGKPRKTASVETPINRVAA